MFHLAGGITFCVNIADFLELQRAFHRQRIIRATAEIKDVSRRRDMMGHVGNIIIMGERSVQSGRRFGQMLDDFLLLVAGHLPFHHRKMSRQRRQHGQLAGKGLGRSNPDFGTGMGREKQIGLPRHTAGWNIDNHGNLLAIFLGVPQRSQRIRRLARLRYEKCQTACFQHRIAITEFRSKIEIHRYAGKSLEPIFGDHAGIIAGPAGHDRNPLDIAQIEIHLRQRNLLLERTDIALQRLRDHGRLLENLLLHEMAIIALFNRCCGNARSRDFAFYRLVVLVINFGALAGDDHPVALFKIGNLLGQGGERQGV